jgi:hypothetical protein
MRRWRSAGHRGHPLQSVFGGGAEDAFVAKLNPTGSGLVYSTFLGGNGGGWGEAAYGITVDGAFNAYVTGVSNSPDFPLVNAAQPALGGLVDTFVTRLNASGNGIVYSTFFGGQGEDSGHAIALDRLGNAYVTGIAGSDGLASSPGVLQPTRNGPTDAFVDESIRGRRYLMGCVLIEARHLAEVRPAVAALGVDGARVHFNNESNRQKTRVLDAIVAMPVRATIYVCQRNHGVTQFEARAACIAAIVDDLQARQVGRLVIESRQDDREDERPPPFSSRATARVRAPRCRHEPMLWVADAHVGGRCRWAVASGHRTRARRLRQRSRIANQVPTIRRQPVHFLER